MVTAAAATETADVGNAGRPLAVVTQNYRAKPIKGVAFGLHPLLVNLCTGWVGRFCQNSASGAESHRSSLVEETAHVLPALPVYVHVETDISLLCVSRGNRCRVTQGLQLKSPLSASVNVHRQMSGIRQIAVVDSRRWIRPQ